MDRTREILKVAFRYRLLRPPTRHLSRRLHGKRGVDGAKFSVEAHTGKVFLLPDPILPFLRLLADPTKTVALSGQLSHSDIDHNANFFRRFLLAGVD